MKDYKELSKGGSKFLFIYRQTQKERKGDYICILFNFLANLLANLHQNDSEKECVIKIDFGKEKVRTGIKLEVAKYKRR